MDLATVPVLLARLHDAVAGTAPDYLFTDAPIDIDEADENLAFVSLFGAWLPEQNPRWR
ncbi:hypothetical protein KZZ52_42575 [Dactylosporangium sp. AC04546]|uniref:hypothetical protein n=1 Tax=Dactylosporangium sp. AC04546 TaxID=2862460 RepID=UPI001EDF9019|nr:hypothetical protein [Dactylosporangium sp. AC04546]WVK80601.1 hypothetical protein KZZ52_42575 [Dactylosporangium sp. AC04546]